MSSVVALYDALASAPDDRARARLIAEAFERLEERYPHLGDMATQGHVRESELRLQKEIEQGQATLRIEIERVRAEIEKVRAELKADIEKVRADLKTDIEALRSDLRATELRLLKEIEQVRAEIVRSRFDLLKWIVPLMFAQVAVIAALVKLL